MNLSSNDDDLFDYDPKKDVSKENSYFSESKISSITEENIHSSILSEINLDSSFLTSHISTLALGISSKFFPSEELINDSFRVSVSKILDEITNNKFSKLNVFYNLEKDLIKRNVLICLNQLFVKMLNKNELLAHFNETNTNINLPLFNNLISVSLDINFHIIKTDRPIYSALAKELNLSVNDNVFENHLINSSEISDIINSDLTVSDFQNHVNSLNLDNYMNHLINSYSSVFSSIVDSNIIDQTSYENQKSFLC